MFSIRPLPEFTVWLDELADPTVRGVVVARIKRLERGLMGDVEPVGEGVSELRIHFSAGWRLYFTQRGMKIVVLLVGGTKRKQGQISSEPRRWRLCWTQRRSRHDQTNQG